MMNQIEIKKTSKGDYIICFDDEKISSNDKRYQVFVESYFEFEKQNVQEATKQLELQCEEKKHQRSNWFHFYLTGGIFLLALIALVKYIMS